MDIAERVKHEIEHGEYLARHGADEVWYWSLPGGRRRAQRRADFFLEYLRPGMRALEIGCGTGMFTRLCAPSGATIVAVELSETLLTEARRDAAFPHVTYEVGDAHALKYADASFDMVYGSSVLHHLEVVPALRELHRVLRPGGRLVFAEPNMLNPQIYAERHVDWVRRRTGTSPDETAFVRFTLRRQLASAGFVQIEVVPHDFLHPATPAALIPMVEKVSRLLERMPIVREIAGSLVIRAVTP
jgi:2-polyprenyl-3-methyl-5-hydroxy-6-metoxy-1,4-benzoquinol methylase